MSIPSADRIPTEPLCRVAAAVTLAAVAVIHVVDLPDTLDETPLIAYGYLALIAAALFAATLLLTTPSRWAWGLAGAIGAGAIIAYVLSRTTGLPTDADD
ncbi:MAG TPA: hypothetical protein VFU35_00880, partial [Jatrophihabitans sp.]|nr:hypothetical protein [Jatrophihabitans sp.]